MLVVDTAGAASLDVDGVGSVPFEQAAAACTTGTALEGASSGPPAFGAVRAGRLASGGLDATYVGDLPRTAAGALAACVAVARARIDDGLALRRLCADRAACEAAFPDEEAVLVREALKARGEGRADGFFHALQDGGSTRWASPRPFLVVACAGISAAGSAGRFADEADLRAARTGCLQLHALLVGRTRELDLPCDTPWQDVDDELLDAPTDLGVGGPYPEVDVEWVLDRLARMDPSPARCPAPWAADWRRLETPWVVAQGRAACADEHLPLSDRSSLCPDLLARLRARCTSGDAPACHLVGRMHLDGVSVAVDEEHALDVFRDACLAGVAESCDEVRARAAALTLPIDRALALAAPVPAPLPEGTPPVEPPAPVVPADAATQLLAASSVVARWGPALGEAWRRAQVERILGASLAARLPLLVAEVVEAHGASMPPEWAAEALARRVELESSLAPPGRTGTRRR